MKSTFKLTFYIKKSIVYKNGTSPIMARVRVSGDLAEFSTKLTINKNAWIPKVGKGKGNAPEIIDLNAALGAIEGVVNTIHKDLIIIDGYSTADKIKTKYINLTQTEKDIEREQERQRKAEEEKAEKARKEAEEKEKKERGISLITYYTKYINSREDDVQAGQLTGKTLGRYELVRDRLISYMKKKYSVSDLPLKQVDIFFIRGFEMYIRSTHKCENNATMKQVQKLCTVVTLAHDTGVIPINPFKLYKFHFDESDREILTYPEIDYMYNYRFASEKLARVRDCYVFAIYTGYAYTDADNLGKNHFKELFDGKEWLVKRREKSEVESKVLLLDIPREILKKYEGKLPQGQLLPIISNQNMNDYLKEIADILGINKHLTFHTARHTFATTICLNNGIALESLQKLMGHKTIRSTQIYAKIHDDKLSEDMDILTKRLKTRQRNLKKMPQIPKEMKREEITA